MADVLLLFGLLLQINKVKRNYIKSDKFDSLMKNKL